MVLLGLGRKSVTEVKEEVPEELPDLPEAPASTQEAAPDELSAADLAPDELPPVAEPPSDFASSPSVDDRRLYFSSMLQKLHEEGINSTKLLVPTANLVSDMKKHWEKQRKESQADEMLRKLQDSIAPLQRLEHEWVVLHDDIEEKKKQLKEKEDAIQKLAEEAKNLALQAQKMASKEK